MYNFKPCPFCGNTSNFFPCEEPWEYTTKGGRHVSGTSWRMSCDFCGCSISADSEEHLIHRWNYRWYEHHDRSEWEG